MAIMDNFAHPRGLIGRLMLMRMDRDHRPLAEWSFTQYEIPEKAEILDIGCGGGYNIRRMLARRPQARATGYDISAESVRQAEKVNAGDPRVRIVQGSVSRMPFEDTRFDLATAYETVFFWPAPAEDFREVRRVLKPGGRFVVACNCQDPDTGWEKKIPGMKLYTAENVEAFMKAAGFADVRVSQGDGRFCVSGAAGGERGAET